MGTRLLAFDVKQTLRNTECREGDMVLIHALDCSVGFFSYQTHNLDGLIL